MKSESLQPYFISPSSDELRSYRRNVSGMRPLDHTKLEVVLLEAGERKLKTPVTGDMSLVTLYKGREGVVGSFGVAGGEVDVLQLQGARHEGFRVSTGLQWVKLYADHIRIIAEHPESAVSRVTMPPHMAIDGFVDATEAALKRYQEFAERLEMQYSAEEKRFVKDIKSFSSLRRTHI